MRSNIVVGTQVKNHWNSTLLRQRDSGTIENDLLDYTIDELLTMQPEAPEGSESLEEVPPPFISPALCACMHGYSVCTMHTSALHAHIACMGIACKQYMHAYCMHG